MTYNIIVRMVMRRAKMILIFFALAVFSISCTPTRTIKKWVNWNVLFSPGADATIRNNELARIKQFITDSATFYIQHDSAKYGSYVFAIDTSSIKTDSCFCDTLLRNISADLKIFGSGNSQQIPPTNGGPKPGGGELVIAVSDNNTVNPPRDNSVIDFSGHLRQLVQPRSVNGSFILAIIDTGIDTTLFQQPGITNMLWQGAGILPQARNFLEGVSDRTNFYDDDHVKHGSAVAAVAIQSLQSDGIYPQLMVLKAFDANANSSLFSVSCALKYAIDHNASLINTSWGYYGRRDPVLRSYIELAATKYNHPIPIIAAAGNDTTTGHLPGRVCSTQSNFDNTFLGELRWYYPACFAPTASNIISVTGMNDISHPCYYQNFSHDLITVGVVNNLAANHLCCSYRPGYMSDLGIMEGSSFATPVISGRIISWIIQNGFRNDMRDYLRGIGVQHPTTPGTPTFTIDGQYFLY